MNEKQLNIVNFKALSLHRSVHAESKVSRCPKSRLKRWEEATCKKVQEGNATIPNRYKFVKKK